MKSGGLMRFVDVGTFAVVAVVVMITVTAALVPLLEFPYTIQYFSI